MSPEAWPEKNHEYSYRIIHNIINKAVASLQ